MTALAVLTALEYRPEPLEDTPIGGTGDAALAPPDRLTLLTWNLGYAGLGRDADFFMDGGAQVRPGSIALVRENLEGILRFLKGQPADLFLLQEVDSRASRTYGIDEVSELIASFPGYFHARAENFKVPWVPVPVLRPLGQVESGLLTLSKHQPTAARRHQLPGLPPWPRRMFDLKRCLHELRLPAPDGRDWVILHLHLSTFDKGGELRRQQMNHLKTLLLRLRAEGHHVIAGGDWNHALPGIADRQYPGTDPIPDWFERVPAGWTPEGWQWAFDPKVASLRATNKPYLPGESFLTTIDGFLVSPDLEILSVETTDLQFAHSDHQPVRMEVKIR